MNLNCDMGEGLATDEDVMPFLQQASIACGGHAGDSDTMRRTIKLAKQYNVQIGAHPSYPDKENFGRISMDINDEELYQSLLTQLTDLNTASKELHTRISYIKPHGALNNDMVKNDDLFALICKATKEFSSTIPIMVQMTSRKADLVEIAKQYNLEVIWEIFADRAYEKDGTLRNRKHNDAVHQNPASIVHQVREITQQQRVPIHNSTDYYSIKGASSICIHGDNAASIIACPQLADILNA